MVHHWISLQNNRINQNCLNKRVIRIFQNSNNFFYGDYNLDIYLGTKNDYHSLESMLEKVISIGSGWIHSSNENFQYKDYDLEDVISQCGSIDRKTLKKIFPKRETFQSIKTIKVRNDGNFILIGVETSQYYYIICFATS
jgi:hypothetical protein